MENPTKKVSGLKVLLNKPEILQIKEKNVIKEPEFTNCSTCGVEFGKIFTSHKLKFCKKPVCEKCSQEKLETLRICDICFMKKHYEKQETRRDEFLEVSKLKIDSLKKLIKKGEKELELFEKETSKLKTAEDFSKKQELILLLEEEKLTKLAFRNRALKDYEVYYSKYEEIKEKENSLKENFKKKEEYEKNVMNSTETLKAVFFYKEEEFSRLIEEKNSLINEIKERKEGKSIYSKSESFTKEEGKEGEEKQKKKEKEMEGQGEEGYMVNCKFC